MKFYVILFKYILTINRSSLLSHNLGNIFLNGIPILCLKVLYIMDTFSGQSASGGVPIIL